MVWCEFYPTKTDYDKEVPQEKCCKSKKQSAKIHLLIQVSELWKKCQSDAVSDRTNQCQWHRTESQQWPKIKIWQFEKLKRIDIIETGTQEKKQKCGKKASSLSPGTKEYVCLVPKTIRHIRMQFETPARKILCLYQIPSGRHPRIDTYTNPFPCHTANPIERTQWRVPLFFFFGKINGATSQLLTSFPRARWLWLLKTDKRVSQICRSARCVRA
jgi:hypothetical protein